MKRKILGMTVAIIVIISLLIVNVPAEEKENNELKKVLARWNDPEVKKILERSHNRKWYSYEELYGKELSEKDREYMRILDRLEREGIDTSELFDEIDRYLTSRYYEYLEAQRTGNKFQAEEFDKVQFARDFEERKLRERGTYIKKETIYPSLSPIKTFQTKGDVATDVIYYPPTYITVFNNDDLYFKLYNASFVGIGVWVILKNYGDHIDYTWRSYYVPGTSTRRSPSWIKDYVKYDLNTYHQETAHYPEVTWNDVKEVHIKYFIQGYNAYWMVHRDKQEEVSLEITNDQYGNPVDRYKKIELWSETTYHVNSGTWEDYGYPWANYGGATLIDSRNYVYTSTGNAYYATYYPTLSYRSFGGGSETGIILTLWSHPLHQQAVLNIS